MKIRKHFRTSSATIDYIIADFTLNRITNHSEYFMVCVNQRIQKLSTEYNDRVDKMLNFLILHCNFDSLPLDCISKIIYSLSKVTNALSKGIMYLIGE